MTLDTTVHALRKLGLAGFTFFMVKGLLWILVPLAAHSALFN